MNTQHIIERAERFNEMVNGTARDALTVAIITAPECHALADTLRCENAARNVRLAGMVPNRQRLAIIAQALCDERAHSANTVSKKMRKVRTVTAKLALCETLARAAEQFPQHPTRTTELLRHIENVATAYGLTMPKPNLRKPAPLACPFAVSDAVIDFAWGEATPRNLANAVSTLRRYCITVMHQHDALPARILNPEGKAEEKAAPIVHRIPAGALDWCANSSPKAPEEHAVKAEAQRLTANADLRQYEIAKARKAKVPANRVSKLAAKWGARMGKEVLTLKK